MKQKIVYKYDFINPFHQKGLFLTLEELQKFTKAQNISDQPCRLKISSVLQIIDPSRKANKKKIFTLGHQKDPTIIGETTLEKLTLWVVDKLLFPKDIPDILMQKYGSTYNFDKLELKEDLPIQRFKRLDHQSIGLYDPKIGGRRVRTWYTVYCEQFKHGDIVLNNNLHQIWDAQGGVSTPTVLTELLKKDYGLSEIER